MRSLWNTWAEQMFRRYHDVLILDFSSSLGLVAGWQAGGV
jgi:hypothetical protein